ncbi:hypothetical protein HW130_08705 [Streptomyces sp. PKU-EA00015]|uniref:hypothetical protein n=1 Tax=Streptomyces sp. PKU-EA00015 TaxID=2748326 RepID=UPI0015A3E7E7|nr:hypothetical protein [Streptomyces sp. PKU-EA00015]NWF26351.1 hypothetical protein [Streptomyces sp. PKU-EA00015]
MERTAALRLDAEWAKIRAGRPGSSPRARERMLTDLIAALAPHAADDLSLTARLSLRYGDLARHHFDTGSRTDALAAVDQAVRHCAEPARHDDEHARWYARALISQAVYLAEPLSDELGLPRYAFRPHGERPPAEDRLAGLAAVEATHRAIAVWEGLDRDEPRNQEGLAQAYAFLGDRLEELGRPVDAAEWAVRAERAFHAVWTPEPPERAHAAVLGHLGDQLERRLRRCPFDGGLTQLHKRELLPERLVPLAVLAARIEGVAKDAIAEGLALERTEVRRILRARSWRAVWRFDVRAQDGPWTPMACPWRGTDAVTDRTADAVAADLPDAFLHSPDRPPDGVPWRFALWWEEEDHLDGARFRRTFPSAPDPS